MTITEIGCQVVKAGVDIMDETTHEGKILMKTWKTATSEKTGPYRIYWGMEVENPTNLWCFFDFESLAHHQKFLKECVPSSFGNPVDVDHRLTGTNQIWRSSHRRLRSDPRPGWGRIHQPY